MNKLIVGIVSTALVVGAGAFYGGMRYAQTQMPQRNSLQRVQQFSAGTFMRGGERPGGGFVLGNIISKDDKSITVKNQGGGSKIIFFSTSTLVTKASSGSANDLVVGEQVSATGNTNTDGSVTAQSIQIRSLSETGR